MIELILLTLLNGADVNIDNDNFPMIEFSSLSCLTNFRLIYG